MAHKNQNQREEVDTEESNETKYHGARFGPNKYNWKMVEGNSRAGNTYPPPGTKPATEPKK